MYDAQYEYLPMQVRPTTQEDIWGSWGQFGDGVWKPFILTQNGDYVSITVYDFNETTGWEMNATLSLDNVFTTLEEETFKLFDINGDGTHELLRVSSHQVDVIEWNTTEWNVHLNVSSLMKGRILAYDVIYDTDIYRSLFVSIQQSQDDKFYMVKYQFNETFDLNYVYFKECPLNFIPTSVKMVSSLTSNNRKRILLGGLIEDTYYSQLFEFDMNLNLRNWISPE